MSCGTSNIYCIHHTGYNVPSTAAMVLSAIADVEGTVLLVWGFEQCQKEKVNTVKLYNILKKYRNIT